MGDGFSVSLILPAYDEAARIGRTIAEARAYFDARGGDYEIIVCADGTDGTRELAGAMARDGAPVRVLGTAERRGKGLAVRSGVAVAEGDVVGFADADNKTKIDDFDRFAPWLRDGYDVVMGSRALADSRIERPQPWHRRLGSRGFGLFMHAVVGLRDIVDTQCGFKFFQRQVARDLFKRQRVDGYMFDVEVLYLARQAGYRIVQVPVNWRDDRDSRLALVSGNVRNVLDVLRIRFGR
ncbi:MAG: dolichyl-phosphate beta-glucosyltransferase [Candidatus Rokuibacteriota bacterium]